MDFFSTSNFMPHGHCYLWKPEILWLHLLSDLAIGLSYFSIPVGLYYLLHKRRDISYRWLFKLFAAFILFCGTTHFIAIVAIWNPIYQIEGLAKAATAIVSAITAICLFPALPRLLALRSPEELEKINRELKQTLAEKSAVERKLVEANENLELEIDKRTRELIRFSSRLQIANTELESFAHQASHDLKSPLNNILVFMDELKRSSKNLESYEVLRFPRFHGHA